MHLVPTCGFPSCTNFRVEGETCYLHDGYFSNACIDCQKVLKTSDYLCHKCAEKRTERYCNNCKQYSWFVHTEDTSITFGVDGGSRRWSQTTFAYAPPVCERCKKNRNHHWSDDYLAFWLIVGAFFGLFFSYIFFESAGAMVLTSLICAITTPLVFSSYVEFSEKRRQASSESDHSHDSILDHAAGHYLDPTEKSNNPRFISKPSKNSNDVVEEAIAKKKQIRFLRDNKNAFFEENLEQMKSIVSHFGISLDFNPRRTTMKNLQSRVKAFNKLVDMKGITPATLLFVVNNDLSKLTNAELRDLLPPEINSDKMNKLQLFDQLREISDLDIEMR